MKAASVRMSALMLMAGIVVALILGSPATLRAQTTPASAPVATAPKAPKLPAPTTDVDKSTCTQAGCHSEVKDYKAVHGPVNVDACNACHKLTDAAKHQYDLTRPKATMCTFCHKIDTKDATVIHQPFQTGDCLGCHNPHGGKTPKILRGDTMRAMCATCHKDVVGDKKFVHGPVAAGACDSCHLPHASKNPKLLIAPGKTLCIGCHKEMGEQLKNAKVQHKPVVEGECVQCHDPHASNYKMQVKAEPAALCTSCHEHDKIKDVATKSKDTHAPVMEGQACLNCHTPHGGQLAKLVKAQPADICMKCHKNAQKAPDGRVVDAVPEILDPKLSKHGPIRDGTCSGCHNPHGSDQTRLLVKAYPESFYTKYDPDNFALCFSCHDKQLVEVKDAKGLTGFRNGTQNLHYLHVDKDKGRTCRACHETHAGPNPAHLRDSVPFGQWDLPINFKKTADGGSCSPGCHKEYAYDRTHPVDNGTKPTVPTAPPASNPTQPASGVVSAPVTLVPTVPAAPAVPATAPKPDGSPSTTRSTDENQSTLNLRGAK